MKTEGKAFDSARAREPGLELVLGKDVDAPRERARLEKCAESFDLSKLLDARRKTWEAIGRIAQAIRVGMNEEDAYEAARGALKDMGASKNWHRPWIRFGPNTLKPYGVLSQSGAHLRPNDLFFIDIGPVWDGYEGDGGETFVVGSDDEMRRCKEDVRKIFDDVKARWAGRGSSGRDLYRYAVRRAEESGWRLNMTANGHRLSEFPHAVHFKGGMAGVDFRPSPNVWVLEVQIRHPVREFGAFYEDILF